MIQYFADYLGDYEGEIPWDTLHKRANACDFKGMPEPFSLKKEPPGQYYMQVLIARKPDGKHDILKDVSLLGGADQDGLVPSDVSRDWSDLALWQPV